jgi:hypothetical protein
VRRHRPVDVAIASGRQGESLLRAHERGYRFIAAPADVTHPVAEKGLFNANPELALWLPNALYG